MSDLTPPARELLPTATPAEARRVIAGLAGERRRLTGVTFAVLVLGSAVGLLVPPILGYVVDVVADGRRADDLIWPLILLAGVAVVEALLAGVGGQLTSRLGEGILAGLRERVVSRALGIPVRRLEGAGSGDLLSRVSGDVAVVSEAITTVVPELARAGLTVGLTVIGLAALDWRLALAGLLAAPIQVFALRWYLRTVVPVYRRQRVVEGERTQQLVDAISGAPTARALGLGAERGERVRGQSRAAADITVRATALQAHRFFGVLNGAELVGLGAILIVGFLLVRDGAISVGAATAAALYFHRAFDPIGALLAMFDDLQEGTTALSRLVGVASIDPPAEPPVPATPADASIVLTGVTHAYVDGHPVLRDVDLTIGDGERVALIGTTGAGKTTLARLIAGVQPPTRGEIRIGGATLAELGPTATRRAVALVTQEVHVFAGALADDLRLARPEATDEDLLAALGRVDAQGWVAALPDGLRTVVGEGGHRLTATQSQHLALARLVLRDPPVVLLDEATAEAGSAGARGLEAAADRALEGRTALVVAHRLTQAATADRVVVLDAGRIVEQGPHDELVRAGGAYATLWAAWASARPAA